MNKPWLKHKDWKGVGERQQKLNFLYVVECARVTAFQYLN